MKKDSEKIKIHTPSDVFAFAGHFTLALFLSGCAIALGATNLPFVAAGFFLSLGIQAFTLNKEMEDLRRFFKIVPSALPATKDKGEGPLETTKKIAAQFNFRKEINFFLPKYEAPQEPSSHNSGSTIMAASCSFFGYNPSLVFTNRTLESLPRGERNVVIAHEIGHLAAHHVLQKSLVSLPLESTHIGIGFEIAKNCYTDPVNIGPVVLGYAARNMFTSLAHELTPDPVKLFEKKAGLKIIPFVVQATAIATASFCFGTPKIAALWGIGELARVASKIISRSHGRHSEYQADRLACEATKTKDNQSLFARLSIYEQEGNSREKNGKSIVQKNKDDGFIVILPQRPSQRKSSRLLKCLSRPFSTHPPLYKRARRIGRGFDLD